MPPADRRDTFSAATKRRSRAWWLWRFVRVYVKHRCLVSRGPCRTWQDAMLARRVMKPAEQWKLGPIKKECRATDATS